MLIYSLQSRDVAIDSVYILFCFVLLFDPHICYTRFVIALIDIRLMNFYRKSNKAIVNHFLSNHWFLLKRESFLICWTIAFGVINFLVSTPLGTGNWSISTAFLFRVGTRRKGFSQRYATNKRKKQKTHMQKQFTGNLLPVRRMTNTQRKVRFINFSRVIDIVICWQKHNKRVRRQALCGERTMKGCDFLGKVSKQKLILW